jgi:hypothetical protein
VVIIASMVRGESPLKKGQIALGRTRTCDARLRTAAL